MCVFVLENYRGGCCRTPTTVTKHCLNFLHDVQYQTYFLITTFYSVLDNAQVALLKVMECVQMSEKAQIHRDVSQLVALLFSSVSFGQSEQFCGCGFVSLLWLRHIIKHRSCLQCEPAFQVCVCVHSGISAHITNVALVLHLKSSLVGSHIACEGKSYCITFLASGLCSLPLVTLTAAPTYHDCFITTSKHV